jgi:hypothetical protein
MSGAGLNFVSLIMDGKKLSNKLFLLQRYNYYFEVARKCPQNMPFPLY